MEPPKKLKQTTLSFLMKPATKNKPDLLEETKKRSRSPSDPSEILVSPKPATPKRPKQDAKTPTFKTITHKTTAIVESAEVSSSSESQSADVIPPARDGRLDAYVKLVRVQVPSPEVSSTVDAPLPAIISDDSENEMSDPDVFTPPNKLEDMARPGMSITLDDPEVMSEPSVMKSPNTSPSNDCTPSTPAQVSVICDETTQGTTAQTSKPPRKLSASALKKRAEQQRIAEERRSKLEAEREEKKRLKLEQKQQREKELEEKRKLKDKEKQEKQKEKEEKQKLKDEENAKKQAELDMKRAEREVERKKREEEKHQKEEEKRKREEEKLNIEAEKKRKIESQKSVLMSFFKKAPKQEEVTPAMEPESQNQRFKPFTLQPDMRMAVIVRREFTDKHEFDDNLMHQRAPEVCLLDDYKGNRGRQSGPTWPRNYDEEDEDIIIPKASSDQSILPGRYKAKLLQFHTDIRPAYFGTWRKKSECVKPRHPLGEEKTFDYENDSADEWEEEEPGESVESGGEDEEEKEEVDFDPELRKDGFLVDHNHLSDDEGGLSEEDDSLAAKKTKQVLARTYGKKNRKKKKLRPAVCGSFWRNESSCNDQPQALLQFKMIIFHSTPIAFIPPPKKATPEMSGQSSCGMKEKAKTKLTVPPEAMVDLIRVIHGTCRSIEVIVRVFRDIWGQKSDDTNQDGTTPKNRGISKTQLCKTIRQLATYESRPGYKKSCWYVNDEELKRYNLNDLPIPNQLTKKKIDEVATPGATPGINTPKPNLTSPKGTQKRLTEFSQPAKKKIRLTSESKNSDGRNSSCADVIDITDSPRIIKSTVMEKPPSPPRRIIATTLSKSPNTSDTAPRRVDITALKPVGNANSPNRQSVAQPTTPSSSQQPQRVTLNPASKDSTSPRRVTLTPVTQTAVSPRRVALTQVTTATTPKVQLTPTTTPKVQLTPTTSTKETSSPSRRVQLITIADTPQSANQQQPEGMVSNQQTAVHSSPRRMPLIKVQSDNLSQMQKEITVTAKVEDQPPRRINFTTL